MNKKLEKLKTALRESIAMAEAATPGPWMGGPVDSIGGGTLYDPTVEIANFMWDNECDRTPIRRFRTKAQCDANLAFTTHARTFHPMFSKMLLATIGAMEKSLDAVGNTDSKMSEDNKCAVFAIGDLISDALEAICRDLPEDGEKLEVSDTPRTDAHQDALNNNGMGISVMDLVDAYEHARTLEIELRAANLKNAQEDGE